MIAGQCGLTWGRGDEALRGCVIRIDKVGILRMSTELCFPGSHFSQPQRKSRMALASTLIDLEVNVYESGSAIVFPTRYSAGDRPASTFEKPTDI
jgi:hypothetical protein